jgi:hypothetical protein
MPGSDIVGTIITQFLELELFREVLIENRFCAVLELALLLAETFVLLAVHPALRFVSPSPGRLEELLKSLRSIVGGFSFHLKLGTAAGKLFKFRFGLWILLEDGHT